ncbi:helix-turn-helix transcriptional regulator [Pseudooceanicola marinus]|uniref:helix-turn-helix transcriptional regulator n=1 Tax=Pseudooceanicola marinus TaxID=396013 RepID=UPI001CD5286F|nr:YafY family protein [Pseudooceanicola marinus]MCA1335584.1 YafY family transcriptional regulator [Pseudooceanicola marinus]
MRRADRLFQIVQHLRGGRLVTGRALAERLEVSLRTIYRDVADLQASGVPIEGEAGLGYVMQPGHDVPPLMFTEEEIVALVAGARLLRAWGGLSMAASAEEALLKIDAVLPEAARARAGAVQVHAVAPRDLPPALRARLDRIEAAVHGRTRLHIRYLSETGAETERVLRPLGLFFWGKVWTLLAWCELRGDFRTFRLDRIAAIESGARFAPERDKSLAFFYAREKAAGRIPADR